MDIANDRHTALINWISSVFDLGFSGYIAKKYGYTDYRPDPLLKLKDGRDKTPDIIAVNYDKKIVLIIECKGGLDEEQKKIFKATPNIDKITNQLNDYSNITMKSLAKYFQGLKKSDLDIIVATYPDFWEDLKQLKKDVDKRKRALWLIKGDKKMIRKKYGKQTDVELDSVLSSSKGVPLPSHCPSIITYCRDSDKNHVAGDGLIRLLNYAIGHSDFDFTIDKIDKVLAGSNDGLNKRVRLLWQLTKDERYKPGSLIGGLKVANWRGPIHNLHHSPRISSPE